MFCNQISLGSTVLCQGKQISLLQIFQNLCCYHALDHSKQDCKYILFPDLLDHRIFHETDGLCPAEITWEKVASKVNKIIKNLK